jgi:hypothetical protein
LTIGFFVAFSLLKKANNFFTNFWHSGDFFLQKMHNITIFERAKILDDIDHCVNKRTIHGLYSQKIAPTVWIIYTEIKDSIKISKSKLTLTLIDLGYTYKKIGDNRRVLYDQDETIGFFVAFSLLKKVNNFFTNFWHSGDKSDFLPILQKMQNITIIYERNAKVIFFWLE